MADHPVGLLDRSVSTFEYDKLGVSEYDASVNVFKRTYGTSNIYTLRSRSYILVVINTKTNTLKCSIKIHNI